MDSARWIIELMPARDWCILIVVLWLSLTGRLVSSREYQQMVRDRDFWRRRALGDDDSE